MFNQEPMQIQIIIHFLNSNKRKKYSPSLEISRSTISHKKVHTDPQNEYNNVNIDKTLKETLTNSNNNNNNNNNNIENNNNNIQNNNNKNNLPLTIDFSNDCYYIDITNLLQLPQKEAASKLGISESMLCKRFKESTKRKWPYRYLRKIEKIIQIHQLDNYNNKQENISKNFHKEEKEKIEKLLKEKEECLKPVKIRITPNDRLINEKKQNSLFSPSSFTYSSNSSFEENSDHSSNSENDDHDDVEAIALQSLELLKSTLK